MKKYLLLVFAAFTFGCGGGSSYPVSTLEIDAVPPTVTGSSPEDGSASVAVNQVLNVTFSESVDETIIDDSMLSLTAPDRSPVPGRLSVDGSIVFFVPESALNSNSTYTAQISGVKDLAGNIMEGTAAVEFTTGETASSAPAVLSTIPEASATDVAINSSVFVTFDMSLDCGIGVDVSLTGDGIPVEGTATCDNDTVTFTPSGNLDYKTTYTVVVSGAVDSKDNYMMQSAYRWEFTTGSLPDAAAPYVTATVPGISETNVSASTSITATFNEEMDCTSITSGTFTVSSSAGSVAGTVTCSNNTAVFDPSSSLSNNTSYRVQLKHSGIKDSAGNYLVSDYIWNFRTGISSSNITEMGGGVSHSIALKEDNTVITCGSNAYGQLGTGDGLDSSLPVSVSGLSNVISVSAGDYHNAALKDDGTVWTWGNNSYGQLGDGTTTTSGIAVKVSGLSGIINIAAGGSTTYAVKSDGTVWAWGDNQHGQIGNGISGYGKYETIPVQVYGISTASQVSAGYAHAMVLKSDGTVWVWGNSQYGQAGNGTSGAGNDITQPLQVSNLTAVTAISAGKWSHSLAVKSDGTVWAWGANAYGQLGNGTSSDSSHPVQVSGLSSVVTIAGGELHSMALKSDGTVWAWGANSNGQVGDGSLTNRSVPVQVVSSGAFTADVIGAGYKHSLAAVNDGSAWAWGYNVNGQLGTGNTTSYGDPASIYGF